MISGIKKCLICLVEKPIDDFYFSNGYPQGYCKKCQNLFAKKWREENKSYLKEYKREKEKLITPELRARRKLLHRYGLTIEKYNEMSDSQNGVCAICKNKCRTRKNLSVDHCHVTKNVRGLLCNDCNNMIGRANDNPSILRSGAEYLEKCWTAK